MRRFHRLFAIIPQYKIAFCMTSKCGSGVITEALHKHYDAALIPPYHMNSPLSWMTMQQVSRIVPSYRRAMFVRNPFERLVAVYEMHIRQRGLHGSRNMRELGFHPAMTFDDFLELVMFDPDADPHYTVQARQSDRVDFLGRYENLIEDWGKFRKWSGVEFPDLSAPHKTIPYTDYYSDASLEKVSRVYALDIETFGYQFGDVSPGMTQGSAFAVQAAS